MKSSVIIRASLLSLLLVAFSPAQNSKPKAPTKEGNVWSLRGRLMGNPHDREAHKKLCNLLEQQNKFRMVAEERKAWLEDNPGDYFELISLITTAKIRLYDPEYALVAAKQFLSNVKSEDNDYAWTNDQIGTLLVERRRFTEAIPYLQTSVKVAPGVSDSWSHLSSAYIGTKQFDAAITATKKSLDLYPSSSSAHLLLGDALAGKGDLAAQETEYKAACNLGKGDALVRNVRASCFVSLAKLQIGLKEYADAEASGATALELNSTELSAYLVRARAMEAEDRAADATAERNKAEVAIKQVMANEKKPPDTTVPLAIFVLDYSLELIRLLEPAESRLTSFEKLMLAAAYFDVGRSADGEIEFRKSLEDPRSNTAQAHFSLAELFKDAGWTQKAMKEYGKAYEMDPENVTYRYEYESLRDKR